MLPVGKRLQVPHHHKRGRQDGQKDEVREPEVPHPLRTAKVGPDLLPVAEVPPSRAEVYVHLLVSQRPEQVVEDELV